jgi:hypothetical protein
VDVQRVHNKSFSLPHALQFSHKFFWQEFMIAVVHQSVKQVSIKCSWDSGARNVARKWLGVPLLLSSTTNS